MRHSDKLIFGTIALLMVVSAYMAGAEFHRIYMNDYAHKIQMQTLVEIERMCNQKFPLILNNNFYECYQIK